MGKEKRIITKGRYEVRYRGTTCLNCGQPLDLTDKYCPHCGQPNSTKKLTLKDFVDEFLSNLINYDSKLLKTLYTMMVKPGTITREYINGKRISYTNPFRFLFSLAFIYFLMFNCTSKLDELDQYNLNDEVPDEISVDFELNPDENDTITATDKIKEFVPLDSIAKQNPELSKGIKSLDTLDYLISEAALQQKKSDSLKKTNPKLYFKQLQDKGDDGILNQISFFYFVIKQDTLSTFEEAEEKYNLPYSKKSEIAFSAARSVFKAISAPGTWLNDTIAKLPFVVFLFLPVFTIFIFLAYIRKNYTYTDHLIFSFHNQSLLFILLILSWCIDFFFGTTTQALALFLFATYLFQAMRKFYGQGIFKTIVKYVFLNAVFSLLAIIAITLLSLGSAVTY